MTDPAVNTEKVTALFEERQRFESWLAMLESKRATTPAHIFERVHADYAARLARVVEELGSHRAALQDLEHNFMERLTSLDVDDAKNRDEALEAELRSTVGELSAEHHEEVRSRTQTALAAVADERSHVAAELAKLRTMLEASGGTPASAPAAAAPNQAAAQPSMQQRPPAAAPHGGAAKRDEWQQVPFDRAVQTPARPAAAASAAPMADTQPGSAAPRRNSAPDVGPTGGPFDDLEFLKTMIEPRTSGEGVAVGSGAGAPASRSASGAIGSQTPPQQVASTTGASLPTVGRAVEENTLPKEGGQDQVKTLKCQECGTLNYPTEWYCERCGAELAAL